MEDVPPSWRTCSVSRTLFVLFRLCTTTNCRQRAVVMTVTVRRNAAVPLTTRTPSTARKRRKRRRSIKANVRKWRAESWNGTTLRCRSECDDSHRWHRLGVVVCWRSRPLLSLRLIVCVKTNDYLSDYYSLTAVLLACGRLLVIVCSSFLCRFVRFRQHVVCSSNNNNNDAECTALVGCLIRLNVISCLQIYISDENF